MVNELVRMLAAFAKHPEHGFVSLAQSIPRLGFVAPGGGPVDPDPEPAAVTIENDVDHKGVAKNLNPSKVPAVIIYAEAGGTTRHDKGSQRARFGRGIFFTADYITDAGADPAKAARDCGYYLRAIELTMARLNNPDEASGFTEYNGVKLVQMVGTSIERDTVAAPTDSSRLVWGSVTIELEALETLA